MNVAGHHGEIQENGTTAQILCAPAPPLHAQPAGGDRAGDTIPCHHSAATLRDMQTPLGVIEGP